MIPNQWYAILESREVPIRKPVGVTRLGERLALWRTPGGEVACVGDQCPHRGAALSVGGVHGECIQCPFHGFEFDPRGQCRLIPANGRAAPIPKTIHVRSYPVREAHGFIWLWWGESRETLPPLPFFADLDDRFTYSTFRDHWTVHYSRAVENQLDVVHLPFVHRTTIGRGNRTIVDGPPVELKDDVISVWTYNRVEDGIPALRAKDLPPPERGAFVQFAFPNIWQLRISPTVRIFVAFAPIDDENTLLYTRYYHRVVELPVLREAIALAGKLSSIVILRQDKRVVITQRPKRSYRGMPERLIPGDSPIILYRSRRQQLIDAAPRPAGDRHELAAGDIAVEL